jgi:branched-chain amino acid transport system permease protein
MEQLLLFALLGLGTGALIAGIALGVVLTYRGSGVISLATGASAMVGGYAFWSLKAGVYGVVFGTTPALLITLLVSMAWGAIVELVAFRPLRSASPLAKLVSSLGVLLVAQAAVLLAFGTDPKAAPAVLGSGTVQLFGVTVPADRFLLAGIVIAAAATLAAVYRWTQFGLATRAAAENEASAMLAGLSPNALALANTVLASVVAGALGVLAASLTELDAATLPLLIVPALAAALLARFTSFGLACAAGLAIGVIGSLIDYASSQSWFPQSEGAPVPGVQEVVVFVIIVLAMFWRGASLPTRGELVEKRLAAVPRPDRLARPAVIVAVVAAVALVLLPFGFRQALINSAVGTVILLSLVVITGFIGQMSVVQLALSGIAGFGVAHLAADAGIGFPIGPVIAVAIASLLGLVTAFSALRVRGVSLAVVTLAAAVAIQSFVFANGIWGGGSAGGAAVPEPTLLGLELGPDAGFRGLDGSVPSPVFGLLVLAVAVALCLLVGALRRAPLGQRMLAVRSNERAAAAAGIDVRATKLLAFGLGSAIAGVAGVLYAYDFSSVSASRFDAMTALGLIAYAYTGGITRVSGAVIGGLLTAGALVPHVLQELVPQDRAGTYLLLIGGVALLATLILNPDGIAGTRKQRPQTTPRRRARLEPALAGTQGGER